MFNSSLKRAVHRLNFYTESRVRWKVFNSAFGGRKTVTGQPHLFLSVALFALQAGRSKFSSYTRVRWEVFHWFANTSISAQNQLLRR